MSETKILHLKLINSCSTVTRLIAGMDSDKYDKS